MRQDPYAAVVFARLFLQNNRWPEAEDTIRKDPWCWSRYLDGLYGFSPEKKIEWLKKEGVTDNLLDILNRAKHFPSSVQEYICIHRPDLINRIKNLDPKLAEKYKEERVLAKVDI